MSAFNIPDGIHEFDGDYCIGSVIGVKDGLVWFGALRWRIVTMPVAIPIIRRL